MTGSLRVVAPRVMAPRAKDSDVKVDAVIPARMASERLPGKPLLRETGKYLIQHVWEKVREAERIARVIVATDDQRIVDACHSFGAEVMMTDASHRSGTDRVAEVARACGMSAVLNVQGDEPEVDSEALDRLALRLGEGASMVTLAAPIDEPSIFHDPNAVKVVISEGGHALYFSRAPIPYVRGGDELSAAYLHVGIYGYTSDVLDTLTKRPPSRLEKLERLEQLRALEHGVTIWVELVDRAAPGIDTPEDYQQFVRRYHLVPRDR